jgi:uncharacterized RDD family membrane protein YckC
MGNFNIKEFEKKVFDLDKLEEKERKRNTSGRFNRFGAFFLDFNVERISTSIIVLIVWLIIYRNTGDYNTMINIEGLPINVQYITVALIFIFTIFYNIILPLYIYEGQTIGKKAIGIKIVKANGEKATLINYVLRYITILIIEGNTYVVTFSGIAFFFINQYYDKASQLNGILTGVFALSALIAFFHKDRRAIHDFIGGTKVINIKVVEEYKPKVKEELKTAE